MAFIRVVNDFGSVLIDDNYMNIRLASKGELSLTRDDQGDHQDVSYTATHSSYPPLIALRCSSHRVTVVRTLRDGDTYTFRVGFMIGPDGTSPAIASGNFYIFDSAPTSIKRIGNLCLRNSTGNVVYDSGYDYLSVIEILSLPGFDNSQQEEIIKNYDSDKQYAVVTVSQGFYWSFESQYEDVANYYETDITYMYSGVYFSGNIANFCGEVFQSQYFQTNSSQGSGRSTSGIGVYMVVDVTGL
ncbi:hypothetical protein [Lonsdalea quercina]|uniref:hypothetical protein n=1 Tax=Lonsdalea quercina TaxID=71657 RepID=UPI0039767B26